MIGYLSINNGIINLINCIQKNCSKELFIAFCRTSIPNETEHIYCIIYIYTYIYKYTYIQIYMYIEIFHHTLSDFKWVNSVFFIKLEFSPLLPSYTHTHRCDLNFKKNLLPKTLDLALYICTYAFGSFAKLYIIHWNVTTDKRNKEPKVLKILCG